MAYVHTRLAPVTNIINNAYTTTAGAPILRKPEMTPTASTTYASSREAAVSTSHGASTNKVTAAASVMVTSRGEEAAGRRSGSKRDHEASITTDQNPQVVEVMAPPPKKKKVTYALPHQNMEEGHFYVVLGEDIDVSTQRFKILSLLGEGTFGKVVESWDRKRKEYCAVKIVRNVPKYTRQRAQVHA
ncbi:hypothetical protein Q4I28_001384, partial [Leishmania naiffi]